MTKANNPDSSAFPKPCLCNPTERKKEVIFELRPRANHNTPSGKMTNQSHFAMSFASIPPPFVTKLSTIKMKCHPTAIYHSTAGRVIFKAAGDCFREKNTTTAIARIVPVGMRMVDSHSVKILGKTAKAAAKMTTNHHKNGSHHQRDELISG